MRPLLGDWGANSEFKKRWAFSPLSPWSPGGGFIVEKGSSSFIASGSNPEHLRRKHSTTTARKHRNYLCRKAIRREQMRVDKGVR